MGLIKVQEKPVRWRELGALVVVAVVAAVLSIPAAATSPASTHPVPKVKLPAAAEPLAPYVPQDSCDPLPKPGVSAFKSLMLATYKRGSDGGISRACSDGATSEHKEGRAWDWMLNINNPADHAAANAVLGWLLAPGPGGAPAWNARRLGIMYIIWDKKIWGSYYADRGWRPYDGPSEHTDHIHFSFSWAGAMGRTSWWTGKVAATDYGPCVVVQGQPAPRYSKPNPKACPTPKAAPAKPPVAAPPVKATDTYAKEGDRTAHVLALQKLLHVQPTSGFFGKVTLAAVKKYQQAHHLAPTGVVTIALARQLRLVATPAPPKRPVIIADVGDRSALVLALQRELKVSPTTGFYGPRTRSAVAHYQAKHHLAPSGVLDLPTARLLKLR